LPALYTAAGQSRPWVVLSVSREAVFREVGFPISRVFLRKDEAKRLFFIRYLMSNEINAVIERILAYKTSKYSSELSALVKRLYFLVSKSTNGSLIVRSVRLNKLRAKLSDIECNTEKYHARKIIGAKDPMAELENYAKVGIRRALSAIERTVIHDIRHEIGHREAFIGCGALPLTSIWLAKDYGIKTVAVDNDKEAVFLARKVVNRLGLSRYIRVVNSSGQDFNYANYCVVHIASMAGRNSSEKRAIFKRVKATADTDTVIIGRTTRGLRSLIYAPVDEKIQSMFKKVYQLDPFNYVITSQVFMLMK